MLTVKLAPDPQIELGKLSCGETFIHNNELYIYTYIKECKKSIPAVKLTNGELVWFDKLILVAPVNVQATIELKCFQDVSYEEVKKGYNPFNDDFSIESCEEALETDF